jgi:hypothetical protein
VAKQSEKIDDIRRKKEEAHESEKEEESSAPSQTGDGENDTIGDKREDDDEEESFDEDEVDEQRFVDHTYYRIKIGEGFAQRKPSDLAPSKPHISTSTIRLQEASRIQNLLRNVKNIRLRS